jgi:hypothetical protein
LALELECALDRDSDNEEEEEKEKEEEFVMPKIKNVKDFEKWIEDIRNGAN